MVRSEDVRREIESLSIEDLSGDMALLQKVANISYWKYDDVNDIFYASDGIYDFFGLTKEEADGSFDKLAAMIYPEDQAKLKMALATYADKKSFEFDYRIKAGDGSVKYGLTRGQAITAADGEVIGLLATNQDITKSKLLQAEIDAKQAAELKKLEKVHRSLITNSNDVFLITDEEGVIRYISEAVSKVMGISPEDRLGKKLFAFYEGEDFVEGVNLIQEAVREPDRDIRREVLVKASPSKEVYLEVSVKNLLHDPDIAGIVVNYRNITDRKKIEQDLIFKSSHDEITKLPSLTLLNRELFIRLGRKKAIQEEGRELALFIIDIDGLKKIKYNIGYREANSLLVMLVTRLQRLLPADTFVAKYAENVYAAIVEGNLADFPALAHKLIRGMTNPFRIDGYDVGLRAWVGVSFYPSSAQDSNELMQQAVAALGRAQSEGLNRYKLYSAELDIQSYKDFKLRSDIYQAIEKNELEIFYQPVVKLETNEILSLKAELRWNHPDWGWLRPNEFMIFAEEIGLAEEISRWKLDRICQDLRFWKEKKVRDIKIGTNVSFLQVIRRKVVEELLDTIDSYTLEPSSFIFTISEDILKENEDKVLRDVRDLQAEGVQIGISKFGTGNASLMYVNSFNLNLIEVAAELIGQLPADEVSLVLVDAILGLASKLGIKAYAEGIASRDQLSYLLEKNCYAGKGPIYGDYMTREELSPLLLAGFCEPDLGPDQMIQTEYVREERRKYFRVELDKYLEGKLQILYLKGRPLDIGNSKILLKNIGPEGLSFLSNISLPLDKEVLFKIEVLLAGKEMEFTGRLVWMRLDSAGIYQYGLVFQASDKDKNDLIQELNQLQIKIKRQGLAKEINAVSLVPRQYFNK